MLLGGATTFFVTTLSITTFSITTRSIMKFSITKKIATLRMTLGINPLETVMLSVANKPIMLNVVILSVLSP